MAVHGEVQRHRRCWKLPEAVKGTYSLKITFGRSTLNANDHSGFDTTAATVALASAKNGYWQIDISRSVEYDDKQAGQKAGAFNTWNGNGAGLMTQQVVQQVATTPLQAAQQNFLPMQQPAVKPMPLNGRLPGCKKAACRRPFPTAGNCGCDNSVRRWGRTGNS